MPMNFGRVASGATSGLGRALGSVLNGGGYADAYDKELTTQAKLAQALAQIRATDSTIGANEAAARLHDAQVEEVGAKTRLTGQQADVLQRRPGLSDLAMAASAGTDVPTLNAYRQKLTTGQAPQELAGFPDEGGWHGTQPMQFSPAVSSKLGQAFARLAPLLNAEKDINPDQYAKALDSFRANDLGDQMLAGQLKPGAVGASQAAVAGKPLYHAGENGAVLDLFGGGLATDNPLAQGNIGLIGAKTKEQQAAAQHQLAGAAAQSAAAGKYRAETGKIGAETDQIKNGPKGVLVQTDAGPVFADPRTGQALPVVDQAGQPMGAKLKPIPPAVNTAIITNAQNLSKVDQALSLLNGEKVGELQGDQKATGWKGFVPGSLLNRMDPTGIDTRAMISDIGSLILHDRSGAAVTASEYPRLAPFIPLATDDPQTVKRKLTRFRQVYQQEQQALADTYSKEQGYQPSPVKAGSPRTGGATGDFGGPQRTVTVNY